MAVFAALAPTTNVYRLLVLLHILAAIVGFGSSFVYPILGIEAQKRRGIEAKALSDGSLKAAGILTTPVIYAVGVIGLILVAVGPAGFDDPWVSISLGLFIIAVLFTGFVHVPNLEKMNALITELAAMGPPPEGATGGPPPQAVALEKRGKDAGRNGGIFDLLFLVILFLMVWGNHGAFT